MKNYYLQLKTCLIIICIALMVLNCGSKSKPVTGYWIGTMEMNGKAVDIQLDFNRGKELFSSKDMMLGEVPVSNIKMSDKDISFSINLDVDVEFKATLKDNQIEGTVSMQGGPPNLEIRFKLEKKSQSRPIKLYTIEKLTIKSKDVKLSARIYKPKTDTLHPALVLLHGSTSSLKSQYTFYADFFANLGFEVLIFDKRGNGESTGNYATSNYDQLVDDAIVCLETMKNRKSIHKHQIGLWGISQGAMLLPMVAEKTDIPSFLIAKSPEVVSVTEAAAFSDRLRVINLGNKPEDGDIAAKSHRIVGRMILNGSSYKEVQHFINQNALKYPFMNQTGLYGNTSIDRDEFEGYYWKGRVVSFRSSWKSVKIPTLVLFGEDDAFVDPVTNSEIIQGFNNHNIQIKMFQSANHVLKKTVNPAKYPDFDWPRVIEGYTEFVERWLRNELDK